MFETILLLTIFVIACFAVLSDNMRRSIIYLGVFSLAMALAYLHYNAPDVAIAEAAIGVGLSTVMYLVALKKVSVYDIAYVNEDVENFNDDNIGNMMKPFVRPMELFLERTEEVEPQIAYTNHPIQDVLNDDNHDCIVHRQGDLFYIYGNSKDRIFQDIVANLDTVIPDMTNIRVVYKDEVNLHDADEEL